MAEFLDIFLRCLVIVSLVLAALTAYFSRKNPGLFRILLLYLLICLTFIQVKWLLHLDLGSYDAALYHSLSLSVREKLHKDLLGNLGGIFINYSAYTVPLGIIYYLFGGSQLIGQMFSALIGLGVLVNVYRLAEAWFDRRTAQLTSLCLALYPFGWVLAGTLNRDLPILFFLTALFRLLTRLSSTASLAPRLANWCGIVFCATYLALLRPPLLLLLGLSLMVFLLVSARKFAKPDLTRPLRIVALSAIILLVGGGLFHLGTRYRIPSYLFGKSIQFLSLEEINKRLDNSSDADSAYAHDLRFGSLRDILTNLPRALLYFMFSPFPWQVRSVKHALGLMDSVLVVCLTFFFIKGCPSFCRRRRRVALFLLAFVLAGVVASSIIQANVGGAMRHRTMFTFLMFPVAVHGFLAASLRRKQGLSPYFSCQWQQTQRKAL